MHLAQRIRRVLNQIVSREANVRAPALRVALGEADATFVYTSDAATDIRDQVQAIERPQNLNVLATYPIAAIQKSQNPELAQGWIDLVLGAEGQRVLEEYGFLPESRRRKSTRERRLRSPGHDEGVLKGELITLMGV